MLECMFAEDEEKWSGNLQKDKALFEQFTPDTKIEFILAQKDKFAEQIKSAMLFSSKEEVLKNY